MTESVRKRPGGEMSSRPLHFIWILDCSGSMGVDGKIEALNFAIAEMIPHMRDVAKENPNAQVLIRALKFSDGAHWVIPQPIPIEDFTWNPIEAGGLTDLGMALTMVSEQLKIPPMTEQALPPVLVLVSDGQPTDDYQTGLKKLLDLPWGKKAVRIAVGIGKDVSNDILEKFINNSELKVCKADNPEALLRHIKWASTAVLKVASSPNSQSTSQNSTSNLIMDQQADEEEIGVADVW